MNDDVEQWCDDSVLGFKNHNSERFRFFKFAKSRSDYDIWLGDSAVDKHRPSRR